MVPMTSEAKIREQATELLGTIQARLSAYDINFKPFTPTSLAKFNRLYLGTRTELVQILSAVTQTLNNATQLATPDNLDDYLIRESCHRFDLQEPLGFLPLLEPDDIIEIYSGPEKTQVFRNFTFLKYCSYDLLTLLTTPYPELYWREERYGDLIAKVSDEVWLTSNEPRKWQVEDHIVFEKQGILNSKFKMRLKYVGPIFRKDGSRFGWISSIQVMPLGSVHDDLGNVRAIDSRIALKK